VRIGGKDLSTKTTTPLTTPQPPTLAPLPLPLPSPLPQTLLLPPPLAPALLPLPRARHAASAAANMSNATSLRSAPPVRAAAVLVAVPRSAPSKLGGQTSNSLNLRSRSDPSHLIVQASAPRAGLPPYTWRSASLRYLSKVVKPILANPSLEPLFTAWLGTFQD
jgi:hypothetical protein